MNTSFVISPDGTRIAYDVTGEGSPIVLLHGGGHTRQNWHDAGYVERLEDNFKVIAIDIRGNGESDKPIDPTYYTTLKGHSIQHPSQQKTKKRYMKPTSPLTLRG